MNPRVSRFTQCVLIGLTAVNAVAQSITDPNDRTVRLRAGGVAPGAGIARSSLGMPSWRISEPYVDLWVEDEPLGYQPGRGPKVSFQLSYLQRDAIAGTNANIFSFGKAWNCSWLSYIQDFKSTNGANIWLPGGGKVFLSGSGARDVYTNLRLQRNADTNGNTVSLQVLYPSGATDLYAKKLPSFYVDTNSLSYDLFFLTSKQDETGNQVTFNYDSSATYAKLLSVSDADGRATTLTYSGSSLLVTNVSDPFSRSIALKFDANQRLTNLIDVAGLNSFFAYSPVVSGNGAVTNTWMTQLVTVYGTTAFSHYDYLGNGSLQQSNYVSRAITITDPDGKKQIYLYRDTASQLNYTNSTTLIPSSLPFSQVPDTTPYSNTIYNSLIQNQNSFHWGRQQYVNLSSAFTNSSSDFNQLTLADYLKARLRHWLCDGTGYVGEALSVERDPSVDGTAVGQTTWYDYEGKNSTNLNVKGTELAPLFIARVLPNSQSQYQRFERNTLGNVTAGVSTYSNGGSVGQRTNTLVYASNNIDVLMQTNALGVLVSSNLFNGSHQIATNYNANAEKTVYQFDSSHRLTSVTFPTGLVRNYNYYTGSGTNLDNLGFPQSISDVGFRTNAFLAYAKGLTTTQSNEVGLVTTYVWDALQRLLSATDSRGTISYRYSRIDGNSYPNSSGGTNILDMTGTQDRLNNWTYFAYDAVREMSAVTNSLGKVTSYAYAPGGAIASVQDAVGNLASYAYDNLGRLTNTVAPNRTESKTYNLPGQLVQVVDGWITNTFSFNNQGLLSVSSNGWPAATSVLTYDALDRVITSVDANNISVSSTFDNLNRLLSRSYPDGGVEHFGYTANVTGITAYTNQTGTVINTYGYDALGRKTSETVTNVGTTLFAYDPASHLHTLIDPKSQTNTWDYDVYGRVTDMLDPVRQVVRFQYDPGDHMTNRWTAAKGNTTTYSYNALGFLVQSVSPSFTNSYTYDAINELTQMVDNSGTNQFTYTGFGALQTEDGPWAFDTVTLSYTNQLRTQLSVQQPGVGSWIQYYNYLDNTPRLTQVVNPAGYFSYFYRLGAGELLKSITFPNNCVITNTFDSVGRLASTTLQNGSAVTLNSYAYAYNLAGQRTQLTRTDGSYVAYTYDSAERLTSAKGKESGGVTNRLHEQLGYAYDAAGNLSQRTNNALVQTLNVNTLNELTTSTRAGTYTVAGGATLPTSSVTVNTSNAVVYTDRTFAKDSFTLANGANPFTAIAQDGTGRSATNSITATLPATVSFTYDANGNLTSDGTRTLDYDDDDQLIRVTVTSSWKTEFIYDGLHRMRFRNEFTWSGSAWSLAGTTYYVYDGRRVVQERNGSNAPQVTYTRGLDLSGSLEGAGGIGGLLMRTDTSSSPNTYYQSDGMGNVAALFTSGSASPGLAAKYWYDPFGNTIAKTGPLADANVYRFSSKEAHDKSGLYAFGRRFYDPNLQRWLNRDPSGFQDGPNLYAYAHNGSINLFDPYGEFSLSDLPVINQILKGLSKLFPSLGPGTPPRPSGPPKPPTPLPQPVIVQGRPDAPLYQPSQIPDRSTWDALVIGCPTCGYANAELNNIAYSWATSLPTLPVQVAASEASAIMGAVGRDCIACTAEQLAMFFQQDTGAVEALRTYLNAGNLVSNWQDAVRSIEQATNLKAGAPILWQNAGPGAYAVFIPGHVVYGVVPSVSTGLASSLFEEGGQILTGDALLQFKGALAVPFNLPGHP
jgi:RHS repeat-associated protein